MKAMEKPFAFECGRCGKKFHSTSMNGARTAMRHHRQCPNHQVGTIKYSFTRVAGKSVVFTKRGP
jgi:hypothetical protein